jgi:hypothetical protein
MTGKTKVLDAIPSNDPQHADPIDRHQEMIRVLEERISPVDRNDLFFLAAITQ